MTTRLRGSFLSSGRVVRVACLIGVGSVLAACSSTNEELAPKFSEAEYGTSSPRLVTGKKKVPDGGGRYMVGKPYRVAGKTYVPQDVSEGYTTTGTASWYGANFHGRKTANGEIYDMGDLSAAHPTLPLPSYVRVTNLDNDRSVVVRVNDRGPFSRNRVLDGSAATAHMLDFKGAGTAKVKVDYIGPAQMDGKDNQMLVASYRGPGEQDATTMVASNDRPKRTLLAFGGNRTRHTNVDSAPTRPTVDFNVADETMAFGATPPPASLDPLAPLILDATFASSYAAAEPQVITRAHVAAAAMANGTAAGTSVTAPVAITAPKIVQIGTFSDISNAKRVAGSMAALGEPVIVADHRNGQAVHVVRLRANDPQAAIVAAGKLGLPGAFVVRNAR